MITVKTYEELAEAVKRDETVIRLEEGAKFFYERKLGDALSGGVGGAIPGLLVGGPLGAIAGGLIGASVSSSVSTPDYSERDIARFLIRYYRKRSTGVTYSEIVHR